jgi:ABC-type branched-subunit amino acid transport system substrate-binding protein
MPTTSLNIAALCAGLIMTCVLAPCPALAQLTPQQAAGRQIYTEGTSPSQSLLEAVLGDGSTRVPAKLMPCAGCHGTDGKGRPEGGVVPSDITWEALSRALWSANALERRRPAYDDKSLRRSITGGIDSAGTELAITMPHFSMTAADLDSLVEYLKLLGRQPEPGVTADRIRIGTIVPESGPVAALGRSFADLLSAWFDELNQQGGLYGRKIDLQVIHVSGLPEEAASRVQRSLKETQIFAVAGILAPGAESKLADMLEREGVPVIGAMASAATTREPQSSKAFYILSGLTQQVEVLVKFAHSRGEAPERAMAVVFPENQRELADSVAGECRRNGFASVERMEYSKFDAAGSAALLARREVRGIFFLGNGSELQEMLQAAGKLQWLPMVFQPGPLAGPGVFGISDAFSDRVFFSLPTLPSDLAPEAVHEYEVLVRKHGVSSPQTALSLSVLASVKVLTEGLRQSGRQLSRDKFVQSLSSLIDFQTGLTPVLNFSPTRRIGALGAYVVKLDLKNRTFTPVDSWIAAAR